MNSVKLDVNSQFDLTEIDPDIKAYIYQIISQFEPFVTPETTVAVISRDPMKLLKTYADKAEFPFTKEELQKMQRIVIALNEDGTKIESEGLHENIYEAINIAKDQMIRTLTEIQNDVVSSQDRHQQIKSAMTPTSTH